MDLIKNINTVILSITDECNLRCKYCFVQKESHYITFEICQKVIDLLILNNLENCCLDFFGGEPMLLYDNIIVPTILYAEEKKANIKFNITTNGTLLNESRLSFLKQHHVSLLLSVDGDRLTQDYNRPTINNRSSFDILLPLFSLIKKYFPDITIRGTIYPDTCLYLYDNLNFLVNNGFYNFFFCPDEFSQWSEECIQNLKEELRKISIYYLALFKLQENPIIFTPYIDKFKLIYHNYIDTNHKFLRDCNLCGLGKNTIAINYKGDIFACLELTSYTIEDNPYYLGDIYNGIDQNKYMNLVNEFIKYLFKSENNMLQCDQCSFYNLCELNNCHANCYLKFKDFSIKPYIRCIWDITIFEECKLICLIESINENTFFNNFLLTLLSNN